MYKVQKQNTGMTITLILLLLVYHRMCFHTFVILYRKTQSWKHDQSFRPLLAILWPVWVDTTHQSDNSKLSELHFLYLSSITLVGWMHGQMADPTLYNNNSNRQNKNSNWNTNISIQVLPVHRVSLIFKLHYQTHRPPPKNIISVPNTS